MFRRNDLMVAAAPLLIAATNLAEVARGDCPVGPGWWPPSVRIEPATPEQGAAITVTAYGVWLDTCVPTVLSHRLVGTELQLDVLLLYGNCDRLCGDSPTEWELSVTLENLDAGNYTICATLFDPDCQKDPCTPCGPIGALTVYCPGDINGDGVADLSDLATQLAHFGAADVSRAEGDLDSDGDVDLTDLAELLSNFGVGC